MSRPVGSAGDGATGLATAAEIAAAADLLRRGGVVAFPTETVYGLGADAANPAAVAKIFDLKGRPADHPLIVHLADAAQLPAWAIDLPAAAYTLAAAFWPGPLTLILRRAPQVPDCVTGGQTTVGLRVPAHPVAQALLRAFAGGIAAPSANKFGRVSPTTADHVRREFPAPHAPDAILDGGSCQVGVESTILDLTAATPTLLRPGGVTREQLQACLGHPVPLRGQAGNDHTIGGVPEPTPDREAVRAPGLLESHYAPLAEVHLATPATLAAQVAVLQQENVRFVVLARRDDVQAAEACGGAGVPCNTLYRTLPDDDAEYARRLYQYLRDADRDGFDAILIVPPAPTGLGLAIRDRLQRAASR